jgi:hypothetical protein
MTSYVIKSYVVDPTLVTPAVAPRPAVEAEATRWFVPAWTMLPLAPRRCVVRNPLNGAATELSSGEYAVLAACEGCSTLAEHEAQAARQLSAPPEHRAAIRELLERCARQGLLIPLPDLAARFGPTGATRVAPLAGIAIPTADRPRLVLRLLTGAVALQRRTGAAYRWHVFDDSRSVDNRRANVEAIRSCPDLQVTYHDLSAADSLESELGAACPELQDEVGALLAAAGSDVRSSGRTMNHELLWFAGRRFLSIDDDALVEPRRPPLAREGIDVGLAPKAAFWYDDFEAAFAVCPVLPLDPFAEHERWLGLPMAEAWRLAEREPGGLSRASLPGPAGPYFDLAARVVFTWNHVLGDPGWKTFSGEQLAVAAETRAWLAVDPGAAHRAFDSQVQWRGDPSLRLTPQNSLSTTTLSGLDGTALLPPAVRNGGETDTMIGELTRCIHPAAWTASLPFALPHVRDARRQWLSPTETPAVCTNRVLIDYARARAASIRAHDPAARLSVLGTFFVDLAAASDSTLYDLVAEQTADRASRLTFLVNEQLDDAAAPAAWKQVLRQWLPSPLLRLDSASLRPRALPLEELRMVARDFGRALIAWPWLWTHCREHCR